MPSCWLSFLALSRTGLPKGDTWSDWVPLHMCLKTTGGCYGRSTGLLGKLANIWTAGSHLTQHPDPVLILLRGSSLRRTQTLPLVSLIQLSDCDLTELALCSPVWFFQILMALFLEWKLSLHFYPLYSCDVPGGSDGEGSAYNVADPSSIPGLGRSPGEGNGNPLQYYCLENPMDRGTW